MTVNFRGGLARGHYLFPLEDVKIDEDLAGTVGTVVENVEWDDDKRRMVSAAAKKLRARSESNAVTEIMFMLEKEKEKYNGFQSVRKDLKK